MEVSRLAPLLVPERQQWSGPRDSRMVQKIAQIALYDRGRWTADTHEYEVKACAFRGDWTMRWRYNITIYFATRYPSI